MEQSNDGSPPNQPRSSKSAALEPQTVAGESSFQDPVGAVLQLARSYFSADAVALWAADSPGGVLRLTAHIGLPESVLATLQRVPFSATALISRAVLEEKVKAVERQEDLPEDIAALEQWWANSGIRQPSCGPD